MPQLTQRRRKPGCLAALLLLLLLVVGLLAAAGGLLYFTIRRPAGLPLIVQVRSPAMDGQAELNRPLDVEAVAESQAGVWRLELYADGALAGAQESSLPTGSNPLLYQQNWTPLSTGRHALVARAYDNTGLFADSGVVYVDVVELLYPTEQIPTDALASAPDEPLPSLNDLAASLGIEPQQLLDLNPALAGSDASAPLPAGETLTVPRAPAPPPPPAPGPDPLSGLPPAPGGLTARLDCETAQLTWTSTAGVSQYALYRLGPGDSVPRPVALIDADATAYSDALAGLGDYRYQLASISSGGEMPGPMVTASTPGNCVPPALPPGTVDIDLTAIALETDAAFDGVYCYLSVDGSPFERVPRADFSFLLPDAGGVHYDLAAQLPNHGQFVLAAHPASSPVRLTGDCWGRSGVLSIPLGTFASDDPAPEWNGAEQVAWSTPGAGLVAEHPAGSARMAALALAGARVQLTYALNAGLSGTAAGAVSPVSALVQAYGLPAPENLRIENSTLACEELAQEDSRRSPRPGHGVAGSLLGVRHDDKQGGGQPADPFPWLTDALRQSLSEQTVCGLSIMMGGSPTLLWDWRDETGHFSEAALTGYHVVVNLTDLNRPLRTDFLPRPFRFDHVTEGLFWERDIRPGTRKATLARLTDLPCSVRLDYTVMAVAGGLQSAPSDVLSFESEPCANAANVRVEINAMVVGPVRDGPDACPLDCSYDTLEVVGTLFADSGRWDSRRQWISDPGEVRIVERHEGGGVIVNTEVVRPPNLVNLVRAGRIVWADQMLANNDGGRLLGFWRSHQAWSFLASPTRTIPIGTRLDDWNGAGGLQPFCYTDYEIPARRATVWFTTDETITLRDTRGEATCEITVHIVGSRIDYSAHP